VYIDGKLRDKTPVKVLVAHSPVQVKIDQFEASVAIASYTTTRVFVAEPDSYLITYYEKISGQDSEVSIVTSPSLARIHFDGQPKGFSPLKISTLLGNHSLEIAFDGYKTQKFDIEAKKGYRVVSIITLGKN